MHPTSKRYSFRWSRAVFLLLAATSLLAAPGCKHEPSFIPDPSVSSDCDPDTVYFQNDILPVLLSSCGVTGCHDAATAQDGIILTSYAHVMQTGKVTAFDPWDSEIYEVITESDPDKRMPPPPALPLGQEIIDMIRVWIEQGALNNKCDSKDCDSLNVTFSSTIAPLIQTHCQGCHSGPTPQGGISLLSYGDIAAQAQNGGLYGVVTHEPGYVPMPYNGNKLSECQIAQIKKWIDDGYPQN